MAKRNVYFPDDLDEEMRRHPELPIATICQDAVREALRGVDEDPVVEARRYIRRADRILTEAQKKAETSRKS